MASRFVDAGSVDDFISEQESCPVIAEGEALPKWKRLRPLEDSDDEF